jgi:subfamily B ATP-binding cassette protein MsbA
MNDVGRSHLALDLLFADVVQDVMAVIVGFGVLLSLSWQLTLASLGVAPLVMAAIAIFGRRIRKSARRRQETLGDVTQRLVQILSGIKVIQAFRGEQREADAFQRENRLLFRRSMKVVKNRVLSRTVLEGLNNAIGVAVIFVGGIAVIEHWWSITPGDLTAFLTVMLTTYGPTKNITKGWTQLMEALPAAERFFELLDEPPGILDAPDAVRIPGVRRGIRISKVSFCYGREPVLRDVSLDVGAGEVVALVGRTGAGKTTLADLLLRLHDPDSGSIEIDGIDLRRIQRDSLLDHLAVVTQEPFLFPGSIRDNIRYGRPDATDDQVERAACAAHVDEFVNALPQGFDTEVGDAGVRLSGGQRQRITIARAILKNPSILVFDEATSSLDAKSERLVQEAIDRLLGGRTVFVIAHRLSTIRHADKIVVLENGSVSAVGSHEELLASDGLYRELVALQTGAA